MMLARLPSMARFSSSLFFGEDTIAVTVVHLQDIVYVAATEMDNHNHTHKGTSSTHRNLEAYIYIYIYIYIVFTVVN